MGLYVFAHKRLLPRNLFVASANLQCGISISQQSPKQYSICLGNASRVSCHIPCTPCYHRAVARLGATGAGAILFGVSNLACCIWSIAIGVRQDCDFKMGMVIFLAPHFLQIIVNMGGTSRKVLV